MNIEIVAEGVNLYDINPKKLTSDCMTVIRMDGVVDVVRGQRMVDVFDFYYDLGIRAKKIEYCGGMLNPRIHKPSLFP